MTYEKAETKFPEANWTMTPNLYFEMIPQMKEAEMKVMGAAIRNIYGYRKASPVPMSQSWFMKQTGLSRNSVKQGIEDSTKRGWLKRTAAPSKKRASEYILVIETESKNETGTVSKSDIPRGSKTDRPLSRVSKSDRGDCQNLTDDDCQNLTPYKDRVKKTINKKDANASAPEGATSDQLPPPMYDAPIMPQDQEAWERQRNKDIASIIKIHLDTGVIAVEGNSPYENKTNRKWARSILKEGFTPDYVQQYVDYLKSEEFWADKSISLQYIIKNIKAWDGASSSEPVPEYHREYVPDDKPVRFKSQVDEVTDMLEDLFSIERVLGKNRPPEPESIAT